MSPDSLRKKFIGIDSGKMTMVAIIDVSFFSKGGSWYQKINGIEKVNCYSENGNPCELKIWPGIEAQITYGHLKTKTNLYFDRMYVRNNNVLVGPENKIWRLVIKAIPFDSISKVELVWGNLKDLPAGSGVFRKYRYGKVW